MKTRIIVVAVGSFLAGFVARELLMRKTQPSPAAAQVVTAPLPNPFALPTPLSVTTQAVQIGGGIQYQYTDVVIWQPPESRPGYYDLFDWRIQPDVSPSGLR